MDEVIRWPWFVVCNHNTARIIDSVIIYQSWSSPPTFTSQIVNCILFPAQKRKILAIRMAILFRKGVTSNPCKFMFRIIGAGSGTTAFQFPTTPAVLDPQNTSLFPLRAWQTVFQAASPGSAPTITNKQYLGVVFTGSAGTEVPGSNDLDVHPIFEVDVQS